MIVSTEPPKRPVTVRIWTTSPEPGATHLKMQELVAQLQTALADWPVEVRLPSAGDGAFGKRDIEELGRAVKLLGALPVLPADTAAALSAVATIVSKQQKLFYWISRQAHADVADASKEQTASWSAGQLRLVDRPSPQSIAGDSFMAQGSSISRV